MAMDLNRVMLIGRLTRDPEIRTLPSGTNIANFSIALNRKYTTQNEVREEVSYFNCVVWGKLADIVKQYCQKGKQVAVDGRLRQNRWQDQQSGQNRSTVEIVVENFQLLGRAGEGGVNRGEEFAASPPAADSAPEPTSSMNDAPDMLDDDIPF